ncbi:MAG: FAD-dependent oxidoreductase [Myxococcota bacterium]
MERLFEARVQSVCALSPTSVHLDLVVPDFSFQAGQYCELGFSKRNTSAASHVEKASSISSAALPNVFFPYSIASAPEEEVVSFCIRTRNDDQVTPYIRNLQLGDQLQLRGPGGAFHFNPTRERPVVWLATGTGIAPLRSMFRSAIFQERFVSTCWLFFGVREPSELLYQAEWEASLHERFVPVFSQRGEAFRGQTGYLSEVLQKQALPWLEMDYYLCGVPESMSACKTLLSQYGVSKEMIFSESW